MQNTNCAEDCPFVKTGFCKTDKECPHYMESWWKEGNSETPILIKDCAPKRNILQNQYLQSRVEQLVETVHMQHLSNKLLSQQLKNLVELANDCFEQEKKRFIHHDYLDESQIELKDKVMDDKEINAEYRQD